MWPIMFTPQDEGGGGGWAGALGPMGLLGPWPIRLFGPLALEALRAPGPERLFGPLDQQALWAPQSSCCIRMTGPLSG